MRVLTFDVPPQEVKSLSVLLKKESYPFLFYLTQIFDSLSFSSNFSDLNKRLSHRFCRRYYVLQGRLIFLKAVSVDETFRSDCLMCLHTNERPMLTLEIQ